MIFSNFALHHCQRPLPGGWKKTEKINKPNNVVLPALGRAYAEGRNPAHELSNIFVDSDFNGFLVKGRIDEKLTQFNGCPTLIVESWYIIAPIKRDYIDTYDLEQGDYVPLENQDN